MHREISHADQNFAQESRLSLYVLTGLLGLLIGLDLWPAFAAWMTERGLTLPVGWPREFGGYRIVLLAAILGGARVLYGSLESLPVDVGPGAEVLAGSLNQFGALTIEAKRVAEHTVVGRVIELTARALRDKSAIERTADRMARYFLPVVLVLAAVTFAGGVVL